MRNHHCTMKLMKAKWSFGSDFPWRGGFHPSSSTDWRTPVTQPEAELRSQPWLVPLQKALCGIKLLPLCHSLTGPALRSLLHPHQDLPLPPNTAFPSAAHSSSLSPLLESCHFIFRLPSLLSICKCYCYFIFSSLLLHLSFISISLILSWAVWILSHFCFSLSLISVFWDQIASLCKLSDNAKAVASSPVL